MKYPLSSLLCLLFFMGCGEKTASDSMTTDSSSEVDTANSLQDCASMCSLALECTSLQDQELIFGSEQPDCEERCATMEWSMAQCSLQSATCSDLAECTRHTTASDDTFCSEACSLIVNECGMSTDIDQCAIDCNMVVSGFAGVFYGAGVQCWNHAINENDCGIAEQCPQVSY